jgi:3-polyprenyl-4-hydroxybenzoate decarboxylase
VIGLYNSVWVWYRPGGSLLLDDVARFYVDRQLDILGCDPEDAARWLARAA